MNTVTQGKFTPGPWVLSDDQVVVGDYSGIWHAHEFPPSPETQANARLIAAAPELLAACEAVLDAIATEGIAVSKRGTAAFESLLAAIAKATGGDAS